MEEVTGKLYYGATMSEAIAGRQWVTTGTKEVLVWAEGERVELVQTTSLQERAAVGTMCSYPGCNSVGGVFSPRGHHLDALWVLTVLMNNGWVVKSGVYLCPLHADALAYKIDVCSVDATPDK